MPKLDVKSAFVGCLMGIISIALLGAAAKDAPESKWMPVRFLVLKAESSQSKDGNWRSTLLTVCPWYGKIDRDSLKSRLASETHEMTIRVLEGRGTEPFASLQRGDIVSFDSMSILKAKPGVSARVRHLPSGDAELIKP